MKKADAEALGVTVVPLNYTVNGQKYTESYSDHNGDFQPLLTRGANCGTSQPNMGVFLGCFEEERRKGNQVLCITISSRWSGTYGAAYAAAKTIGDKNIAVFDSRLTAGGLYLLIKEANALVAKGVALSSILRMLPEIRDKISIIFSVSDMAPLRKSGRIGFVRMNVGTILNIKPILQCRDGAVVSDGTARGNTEAMKRLMAKVTDTTREAVVSYVGENQSASTLYHTIKEARPNLPVALQKIGPVLGIHLGLKVLALSALES